MSDIRPEGHADTPEPDRRPGELDARSFARWGWRQLTSMRTALLLLLLLALGAVPGSIIPQSNIDALRVQDWKEQHPTLTKIYEPLGMFDVYSSPWFAAIYLLLVVSLLGCIIPRLKVYWRAVRARPPKAPARLLRMPDSTSFVLDDDHDEVLSRARTVLKKRHYRVEDGDDSVAGEKGYLREAGNLVFHLAVLVVMAGFGAGALWGFNGGVLVVVGNSFANTQLQYDDFSPGQLFDSEDLERFRFTVKDFDAEWLTSGPRAGMARAFSADIDYRKTLDADAKSYDLRVNHPLSIGSTDVFLIGHGYAPVLTLRDSRGKVVQTGPTPFLPTDPQNFTSFGVLKTTASKPKQLGLMGQLYPTYQFSMETGPVSVFGDALNPKISMQLFEGNLGMESGASQSVYSLNTDKMSLVTKDNGEPFRVDLAPGEKVQLPGGRGSVEFEDMRHWVRVQVSETPGKTTTLAGVILALIGLCGSLFIRSRRTWVRVRRERDGILVEIAVLDRTSGGEPAAELAAVAAAIRGDKE